MRSGLSSIYMIRTGLRLVQMLGITRSRLTTSCNECPVPIFSSICFLRIRFRWIQMRGAPTSTDDRRKFPLLRFPNAIVFPSIYLFRIWLQIGPDARNNAKQADDVVQDLGTSLILGAMIFYYPMKSLLSWWLPKYADSLIYMAVLFPVCLFECKVTLLVNTYLKSMRQEALILKINGIAVISSMMLTVVSVALFHNLTMAVFSIVFLYAGRCFLAEYHLQKLLSLNLRKDMMQEMLLVLVFIATGWKLNSWMTMIIYALCYGCYFILNRSKVHDVIMLIKK